MIHRILLVLFILTCCVYCTNYAKYDDKVIERFNDFIRQCHHDHPNPPFPNPRIIVKEAPGMGLGTYATEDIDSQQTYIFLPMKCVMTDMKAREELGNVATGMDDFHALLFYLLREKSKREESFFWPYISILPPNFDIPYYWSDKELDLLKGSEMIHSVMEERRKIRGQYNYVKHEFIANHPKFFTPPEAYSFEQYEWATNAMNSRTIWLVNMFKKRSLVPLLDMVNDQEGPDPNRLHISSRDTRSDSVITKAPWSFKKGEQVFENYGSDNHVNFFSHGFTMMNNSHDCVKVRIEYTGGNERILEELRAERLSASEVVCIRSNKLPEHMKLMLNIIARSKGIGNPFRILFEILQNKLKFYHNDLAFDKQLLKGYHVLSVRARAAHTFLHEEKRLLIDVLEHLKKHHNENKDLYIHE